MSSNEDVYMLGEDILDPYGGAFKVTRGISTTFPKRTLTTPVSEAGFLGVGTGMALRGLRPVVEIMFGDFITLAADQIINHLAKLRYMYNDQVGVPLVIRIPMGGRRGYGPTHSQSLEKIFLGIPGLKILAANNIGDPGMLLYNAIIQENGPVLFIENKILYSLPVVGIGETEDLRIEELKRDSTDGARLDWVNNAPTFKINLVGAPESQVTIASYGYMVDLCRQALLDLAYEFEIFCEVIAFTQLSPFSIAPLTNSIRQTNRLLAVEEGTYTLGWGAEILARTAEHLGKDLSSAARVTSIDSPIPASSILENSIFPDVGDIVQAVKSMV
jgi:pyruvate/2-oxoglutarate/acetoin dehydrogenase E1 component